MLDVTRKYKSTYLCFATLKSDNEDSHLIYLSGYGTQASDLLDKYTKDQRVDNEDLFAEWDKLVEDAKSKVGFSTAIPIENDCVYISTFQDGIGISEEDEVGIKRYTSRGRRRKAKISIISADLADGIDIDMDSDRGDDFNLNDEIEEADPGDDE
jgi:hypothetical protein